MTCCGVHAARMLPSDEQLELEGNPLDRLSAQQLSRRSQVAGLFQGAGVLLTGSTGFLGTSLLEKLLRACPGIQRVYLLVRDKRGVPLQERVQSLLEDVFFDGMRAACPDWRQKVLAVAGDLTQPGLGLSAADAEMLARNVSVVFHVAATVRFDEGLRIAAAINVAATRDLVKLARRMPNLKAFVHMSTAYSNCYVSDIEEKIYPPGMTTEELLKLVEVMNDDQLSQILPLVLGEWPNSYAFTKSIAEDTVRTYGAGLPISILRPSIVMGTAREPVPLWVNSIYGPIGVMAGAGLGVMRTMQVDLSVKADLVPVDLVTNAAIACAWDAWRRHSSLGAADCPSAQPVVYNFVSAMRHPITWQRVMDYSERGLAEPTIMAVWAYHLVVFKRKWMHDLWAVFVHLLPALLVDAVLRYKGHPAMLWDVYAKVHKFNGAMSKFSTNEWTFHEDNLTSLLQRLSPVDHKLFNCDIADIDWEYLMVNGTRGLRYYLGKEDLNDLKTPRKKYFRLKLLDRALLTLIGGLFLMLLWWLFFP